MHSQEMSSPQSTIMSLLFLSLIFSEYFFIYFFWTCVLADVETSQTLFLFRVSIQCMNSGGQKMGKDIAWRPWLKTQIALAGEMR